MGTHQPKVFREQGGDTFTVETDNGGKIFLDAAQAVAIVVKAGAPVDGTSGTGAGYAGPGSLCIDKTNAKLYINTNTAASPLWTVAGAQTT
jgi:hypothetical protein